MAKLENNILQLIITCFHHAFGHTIIKYIYKLDFYNLQSLVFAVKDSSYIVCNFLSNLHIHTILKYPHSLSLQIQSYHHVTQTSSVPPDRACITIFRSAKAEILICLKKCGLKKKYKLSIYCLKSLHILYKPLFSTFFSLQISPLNVKVTHK